jgi:hypothetical protein
MIEFIQPLFLVSLISLIPLIIVYLRKPKVKQMDIPSVQFFTQVKEATTTVEKKIHPRIKDTMFILYLILLILLATAAALPMYVTDDNIRSGHVIFVVDGSASMHTNDRYEKISDAMDSYIGKENTLIIAKDRPVLISERMSPGETYEQIDKLHISDTSTNLISSISMAEKYIETTDDTIVIISDFAGIDKSTLEYNLNSLIMSGASVEPIQIGNDHENNNNYVGITSGKISFSDESYIYTGTIKNFNDEKVDFDIIITNGNKNPESTHLSLSANEYQNFYIDNLENGVTTVHLDYNDPFQIDNKAYINIPMKSGSTDVLYLTDVNNTNNLSSYKAVSSIPWLKIYHKSILPENINGYDMIIYNKKDSIPTQEEIGLLDDYEKNIVIISNEKYVSGNVPTYLNNILPVETTGIIESEFGEQITFKQGSYNIFKSDMFSHITLFKYIGSIPHSDTNVIVSDRNNNALVAQNENIIYIGFNDVRNSNARWNNWDTTYGYPMFWYELCEKSMNINTVKTSNLKTGEVVSFDYPAPTIETPTGSVQKVYMNLDDTGKYKTSNGKTYVANLYDNIESNTRPSFNINNINLISVPENIDISTNQPNQEDITNHIIIVILVLLIMEYVILKRRDDL